MIWDDEILKDIQRKENIITNPNSDRLQIKNAETEMESLTLSYVKMTKPKSKSADVNFIGRNTYTFSGELIGFYLEPLIKFNREK